MLGNMGSLAGGPSVRSAGNTAAGAVGASEYFKGTFKRLYRLYNALQRDI